MAMILDKINTVPVMGSSIPFDLFQWLANLVDTLNEVISDIENVLISQSVITDNSFPISVEVNTSYIPTNITLTSFQLPATTSNDVGSVVEIFGNGSGGWSLLTAAGQTIKVSSVPASATTSVSSANQYDSIKVVLTDATTWTTVSSETTGFTIV